jgi:hypothetical protein
MLGYVLLAMSPGGTQIVDGIMDDRGSAREIEVVTRAATSTSAPASGYGNRTEVAG